MSYDRCTIANYGGEGCDLCVVEMNPQLDTDCLHNHDCEELVVVLSGFGRHVTETGEYRICRGDTFLVKRGASHGYASMEDVRLVNVLFRPEALSLPLGDLRDSPGYQAFFAAGPRLTDDFRLRDILSLPLDQLRAAEEILAAMAREQQQADDGFRFALVALFMQLQVLVSRAAWTPTVRQRSHAQRLQRVVEVLRFMEENYAEQVRAEDIAGAVNMSARSLERLCVRALGAAPMEYLNDLRLKKAAARLLATRDSILDVALSFGFSDSGYFCRAFKKKFRESPREYRKRRQAAPE